jgi:hypothetical protein
MPRKPQAPAPKGIAWNPDIYDISEFIHGIKGLRTNPVSTMVPVMDRLGGLARITETEIFQAGIAFSVRAANEDFPLLSSPVYRRQLVERIKNVEQSADRLLQQLQAIENPADRTTLWAARAIRAELNTKSSETGEWVAPYLRELSTLIEAIKKAKTSPPYVGFAQERGKPSGTGASGMALTRFVAHLAFAALAARGHWTLNKNDQSGTLIEAMEKLRDFLPPKFLPPKDQHPYSTYQRILTDARSEWERGHFPWPKVDQK